MTKNISPAHLQGTRRITPRQPGDATATADEGPGIIAQIIKEKTTGRDSLAWETMFWEKIFDKLVAESMLVEHLEADPRLYVGPNNTALKEMLVKYRIPMELSGGNEVFSRKSLLDRMESSPEVVLQDVLRSSPPHIRYEMSKKETKGSASLRLLHLLLDDGALVQDRLFKAPTPETEAFMVQHGVQLFPRKEAGAKFKVAHFDSLKEAITKHRQAFYELLPDTPPIISQASIVRSLMGKHLEEYESRLYFNHQEVEDVLKANKVPLKDFGDGREGIDQKALLEALTLDMRKTYNFRQLQPQIKVAADSYNGWGRTDSPEDMLSAVIDKKLLTRERLLSVRTDAMVNLLAKYQVNTHRRKSEAKTVVYERDLLHAAERQPTEFMGLIGKPEATIEDVMEALHKRGMLSVTTGKPPVLLVSSDAAIEALKYKKVDVGRMPGGLVKINDNSLLTAFGGSQTKLDKTLQELAERRGASAEISI